MDAVLARRETEEGTESNDLLLQQAETEKRQTDGRNAEETKGRREQAHGPSVSRERLSPISRTPPPKAKWGRTSAPFSYLTDFGTEFFREADGRPVHSSVTGLQRS